MGAWPGPEMPVIIFLFAGKVGTHVYDPVRCTLDTFGFGGNSLTSQVSDQIFYFIKIVCANACLPSEFT